jgi:hypothetical protein
MVEEREKREVVTGEFGSGSFIAQEKSVVYGISDFRFQISFHTLCRCMNQMNQMNQVP